jgi:hypothetical protein
MHEGDRDLDTGPEGEAEARARVDALFERFNRLTPTELGHIGLARVDGERRRARLDAVEAAARDSGRSVLLGEARAEARELVLRRYGEGTLNPTWVGLNWGISGGPAADRVAIVEALADAAAAAVVEDLVEPGVADALSIDAEHVLGLATGDAYEGALSRAIEPPAPDLDDPPGRTIVVYGGALIGGALVALAGAVLVAAPLGVAGGLVFALIVIAQGRRAPDERPPRATDERPPTT